MGRHLYIAVEVQDQSLVADPADVSEWSPRDGCEVYVGTQHDLQKETLRQYAVYGDELRLGSGGSSTGAAEVAVQRRDGVYQYEWRLDIAAVDAEETPKPPSAI